MLVNTIVYKLELILKTIDEISKDIKLSQNEKQNRIDNLIKESKTIVGNSFQNLVEKIQNENDIRKMIDLT